MLRTYFLAYLSSRCREGRVSLPGEVARWYVRNEASLQIRAPGLAKAARAACRDERFADPTIALTRADIERNRAILPAPSALQKRMDWVARTLHLDAYEAACLAALCRFTQLEPFKSFAAAARDHWDADSDEIPAELAGILVGLSRGAVRKVFHRHGNLLQLGMIEDRRGDDYAPSEMLLRLLRQHTTDRRSLERVLLEETFSSTLDLADFDHMSQARETSVAILRGCLDRSEKGAGLLLYGPPGTGKTEFAALLGRACDARVVFAGEMDADRGEPNRTERIAHLSLLSAIGARAGRVIVVVDEADDIFTGVDVDMFSNRTGSKVFINRLVENCTVPTIWITNHPQRLGESVIRRMLHAVEFRKPGARTRRKIVDRRAAALDLEIDQASRSKLSQMVASPAVLASALRAARLGSGDGEMAIAAAASLQKALGDTGSIPAMRPIIAFDVALSSADVDLAMIERCVAKSERGQLSFLFTGLSGTGKSAFARHLADLIGMEVLEKRASDLLGMFVGETEAKIAAAFQEAIEEDCFLIFDEVDSLLLDRRDALRSWEITSVNEMLTWMERHPLPFAATSNLPERLDPAVQRRFTFKAKFGAMTPGQIGLAFERYFRMLPPENLFRVEPLTPGDFAVVARQAGTAGIQDAGTLAHMLEREVSSKPSVSRRIGFC